MSEEAKGVSQIRGRRERLASMREDPAGEE